MNTQFASVWALRATEKLPIGAKTKVKLKSGKTKEVKVEAFLYEATNRDGDVYYFYKPEDERNG